ncbi:hypothetical protein [Planctobacterium marinum]|uniref:hypothetical protein n=1 Tax=Planctobacterium marinum TaxID=1631968 RepID=UPI001E62CBC7|nr:hypothetical protein [Planctobacterium marinum]MCC2606928.1 hypothetical protein [Planctobacterium marinum]
MTDYALPQWLPEMIRLESFGGNWDAFFEEVYNSFQRDFVDNNPVFRGKRLGLKRHPEYDGKSATFWHMISEGKDEESRMPDIRRCERIRWPKAIIENDADSVLKVWAEKKQGDKRIYLWFEMEGYLVVLNVRKGYILPWTAFYIEREHQRQKYNKRYKRNNGNKI